MMDRRGFFGACFVAIPAIGLSGCESLQKLGGGKSDIAGVLGSKLGLSGDQAEGGLGSVLTLAKEKLAAGDFDRITKVIPGAGKYLEKAKSAGAVQGEVGNMSGLNDALGRLGMNAEQTSKFPPAVTEQVGKLGGADLGKLLGGVLK